VALNRDEAKTKANFEGDPMKRFLITLLLALVWALPASADSKPEVPKAGTPEAAVLGGLVLLAKGDHDAWLSKYCHTEDLCFTESAIKSLKRYNLPAITRLAPSCIKAGNKLLITRRKPEGDATRIFVKCKEKGMPRGFLMKKQGADWKFKRI